MADVGRKMRMEKNADSKKCKRKKTRNADGKKKKIVSKQTNKGKKSFFQVVVTWFDPSLTYRM